MLIVLNLQNKMLSKKAEDLSSDIPYFYDSSELEGKAATVKEIPAHEGR